MQPTNPLVTFYNNVHEREAVQEFLMEQLKEFFEPQVIWCLVGLVLLLMEFVMPDINGIEVCKGIKKVESLRDIPIIMIKAKSEDWSLKSAFESGVIDYIAKPFDKVELVVRVTSALKLKHETDQRKDALRRLKEANRKLQILSSRDGLTGISQHYLFDDYWPGSTETCLWKNVIGMLSEAASVKYAKPIYVEPNELKGYGKGLADYKKSINMPLPWPGGWWPRA